MVSAKDLITEFNVVKTYNENKHIVFVLKNGIKVKINPNDGRVEK
jgi:hypothetical protein